MLRYTLITIGCATLLASCCEPAHKDSQPYVVNSLFQETYGRDIDLFRQSQSASSIPDSAYYPIYTFAIQNTGTQDDNYTLQLRYGVGGFDITKHVPAGQVVLFKSPIIPPDSITANAQYTFVVGDTAPNLDVMYYGLSFHAIDSAEIHSMMPSIQIVYGAIDNGPEGCNTPASMMPVNIDSLPIR